MTNQPEVPSPSYNKAKTIASIVFILLLLGGVFVPELADKAEAISACVGQAFEAPQ